MLKRELAMESSLVSLGSSLGMGKSGPRHQSQTNEKNSRKTCAALSRPLPHAVLAASQDGRSKPLLQLQRHPGSPRPLLGSKLARATVPASGKSFNKSYIRPAKGG